MAAEYAGRVKICKVDVSDENIIPRLPSGSIPIPSLAWSFSRTVVRSIGATASTRSSRTRRLSFEVGSSGTWRPEPRGDCGTRSRYFDGPPLYGTMDSRILGQPMCRLFIRDALKRSQRTRTKVTIVLNARV